MNRKYVPPSNTEYHARGTEIWHPEYVQSELGFLGRLCQDVPPTRPMATTDRGHADTILRLPWRFYTKENLQNPRQTRIEPK
jgi:hypothetical protein